jgi:hypothetical protein
VGPGVLSGCLAGLAASQPAPGAGRGTGSSPPRTWGRRNRWPARVEPRGAWPMTAHRATRILIPPVGAAFALIAALWLYMALEIEYSRTIYGAFPSPQGAFQSLFVGTFPVAGGVPITHAAPQGCDHVWFMLSKGYGLGGGSTYVETDEGWVHFPEGPLPPRLICLGLSLFGISPPYGS